MAPGFGEDDQIVCEENNIQLVCPVDDQGRFTNEVTDYNGINVFDANEKIILYLKERNILLFLRGCRQAKISIMRLKFLEDIIVNLN